MSDQFARFVGKKEHAAVAARLPRYKTTVDARPGDAVAIGNDWTRRLFDGDWYLSAPPDTTRPSCSLVFVQSADRNTGAANPSQLGGGETDKHLIYEGLSRVAADAVLAGAETARGGRMVFSVWHPQLVALRASLGLPRHPIQVIATLRGIDIEHGMLFNVPDLRVVLLTVRACETLMGQDLSSRPWITSIVMDDPKALPRAFSRLREMGLERISCIGGRTLATQLIEAGLVHDIYLTTSARPGGEPNTPMYPQPLNADLVVRKTGTGVETGVVFEHLRMTSG